MDQLSKAIASGSLRGARGNSGVIFISVVPWIYKNDQGKRCINNSGYRRRFDLAVQTAYKAVMKPKEGTILTVAR